MTLTWLRLGKVAPWDAAFYVAAQFVGGTAGAVLVSALLGSVFTAPPISAIATTPGPAGPLAAFLAEAAMAFGLMLLVLARLDTAAMRLTGLFVGALIAVYITVEAPLSGMSLNPARTTSSALAGGPWDHAWIYYLAPPLGMLLAVEAYRLLRRNRPVACAKLDHSPHHRCIHCGYQPRCPGGHPCLSATTSSSPAPAPAAPPRPTSWSWPASACFSWRRATACRATAARWMSRQVFAQGRFKNREPWRDGRGDTFVPGEYHNVGGKTKWYGAALLRFDPHEFAADHDHQCPSWPFGYAELAPYYDQAEALLHVNRFPNEPGIQAVLDKVVNGDSRWRPAPLPLGLKPEILRDETEAKHFDGFASAAGYKSDAEINLLGRSPMRRTSPC